MRVNRLLLAGIVVALAVSLVGNIVFGGIVFGRAARPVPVQPEVVALGPVLKTLPQPDRHTMRRGFQQHKEEMQAAIAAVKASAGELREAIAQEPLDNERFQTALANYKRDFFALHNLEQDIFWQQAAQLSPEGRADLSQFQGFERLVK